MDEETFKLVTKGKSPKQIKARKSFESNVKQASNCRQRRGEVSCYSCSMYHNCPIQQRLEEARGKM